MELSQNRKNTSVTYFAKYHHDFDVIAAEVRSIVEPLSDVSYITENASAGQVSVMWWGTFEGSITDEDIIRYLAQQLDVVATCFSHRPPDLVTVSITAGQHYSALTRTFRAEVQRAREAAAAQASAAEVISMTLDEVI